MGDAIFDFCAVIPILSKGVLQAVNRRRQEVVGERAAKAQACRGDKRPWVKPSERSCNPNDSDKILRAAFKNQGHSLRFGHRHRSELLKSASGIQPLQALRNFGGVERVADRLCNLARIILGANSGVGFDADSYHRLPPKRRRRGNLRERGYR